MVKRLLRYLKRKIFTLFWNHFDVLYRIYILYRSKVIQRKKNIRVLFVLAELGAWKTEALYLAMKKHSRFEALIGVTESIEVAGSKQILIDYINEKGYDYLDLDKGKSIGEISPDLLFYYKPYDGSYLNKHCFKRHLKSLSCFISYGFVHLATKHTIAHLMCNYSWFNFVENELVADSLRNVLHNKANNVRVTGIPMQDSLINAQSDNSDPWKIKDDRVRIIYAPHHSFIGTNGKGEYKGVEYATFLDFGEFLLEMAEKYKDRVVFAFKPHPTLYVKLLKEWGKDKTDNYYYEWQRRENTQYCPGEYSALFAHSDALIHDCGSFQIEYHYTHKPVMFLDKANYSTKQQNEFGRMAFKMHYMGHEKKDIEQFIQNVIIGYDPMKAERDDFYYKYLLPPNGKSASENIINTILGANKYE